jgi:hypothetical protein
MGPRPGSLRIGEEKTSTTLPEIKPRIFLSCGPQHNHYIVKTVEYLISYYTENKCRLFINSALFSYNCNARCGLNIVGHMPEYVLPPDAIVLQRTRAGIVASEGRWPVISLICASHGEVLIPNE